MSINHYNAITEFQLQPVIGLCEKMSLTSDCSVKSHRRIQVGHIGQSTHRVHQPRGFFLILYYLLTPSHSEFGSFVTQMRNHFYLLSCLYFICRYIISSWLKNALYPVSLSLSLSRDIEFLLYFTNDTFRFVWGFIARSSHRNTKSIGAWTTIGWQYLMEWWLWHFNWTQGTEFVSPSSTTPWNATQSNVSSGCDDDNNDDGDGDDAEYVIPTRWQSCIASAGDTTIRLRKGFVCDQRWRRRRQ